MLNQRIGVPAFCELGFGCEELELRTLLFQVMVGFRGAG